MRKYNLVGAAAIAVATLFNSIVDPSLSAAPVGNLFEDGFESGTTAAWSATAAPVYVEFVSPSPGAILNDARPEIVVRMWSPTGVGVNNSTLAFTLGGQPLALDCSFDGELATCTPQAPLAEGGVALTAQVADLLARLSPVAARSFQLDLSGPAITVESPADGALTSQTQVLVAGFLDQPATLTLNFLPVALDAELRFARQTELTEGANLLTLRAVDAGGNLATRTLTVTRDTTPPAPVRTPLVTIVIDGGQLTVTGMAEAVEGLTKVRVRNLRTGAVVVVTAAADGSFAAALAGELGDVLAIEVEDAVGLRSAETLFEAPYALPADPALSAPPLDPTVTYDLMTALEFLYTGPNPTQSGVAPGTIEPRRVAWLRGAVRERGGEPLAGARVAVKDRPELGYTFSRADGAFDLVVNGGGLLTLTYERPGFLPSQRVVDVAWRETVFADDVVLVRLDPMVTAVVSGAAETQIVNSTVQTDADGTRSATLIFPAGTEATLVLAGGATQPLAQLHVRATEYTVGEDGQAAMPGPLPPNVGYTYAVELSADEALAQSAQAARVELSQPVALYVENFLEFPVGTPVPLGSFDAATGQWTGSPNGRIVRVLGVDGEGLAQLDVDGDGQPAEAAALAALGITEGELRLLAERYDAGVSLWRSPIPHFTPWDCNWPYGPPPDAQLPPWLADRSGPYDPLNPLDPRFQAKEAGKDPKNPCGEDGSVIDCEQLTVRDAEPLAGTPYSLVYSSARTEGYRASQYVQIPVTGATVPASLKNATVNVQVGGRRWTVNVPPQPNQFVEIQLEQRDVFGRTIQGRLPMSVEVGFNYRLLYMQPAAFEVAWSRFPNPIVLANRGTQSMTLWRKEVRSLEPQVARRHGQFLQNAAQKMGGWGLNVHHTLDVGTGTLYLGDGSERPAELMGTLLSHLAGYGYGEGSLLDGALARQAFGQATEVAAAGDGTVYFAAEQRLRALRPDGRVYNVAGGEEACVVPEDDGGDGGGGEDEGEGEGGGGRGEDGEPGEEIDCGEGGPAVDALLGNVTGLDVAPNGDLYLADRMLGCVRRIDGAGIIRRVAGICTPGIDDGGTPGHLAETDEQDALDAELEEPFDVAVLPDGSYFISDATRILLVDTRGKLVTVAGGGEQSDADGVPGVEAYLLRPTFLAIGPDGELHFSEADGNRVWKLDRQGILHRLAGNGLPGTADDGEVAKESPTNYPAGLWVNADRHVYFTEGAGSRLRRIELDGTIATAAGNGEHSPAGPGGAPALQSELRNPLGLAFLPSTALAIANQYDGRLWLLDLLRAQREAESGEVRTPSTDGGELYVFDRSGRHLRTLDAILGHTLLTFGYDEDGLLTTVEDMDGLVTTIERDPAGVATAVLGPFGQRTELEMGADGYLERLVNPADEAHAYAYFDGLLAEHEDPLGHVKTYLYGDLGRLAETIDQADNHRFLSRRGAAGETAYGTTVTGDDRPWLELSYSERRGGEVRRTRAVGSDVESQVVSSPGYGTLRLERSGESFAILPAPDPRLGPAAAYTARLDVALPGGIGQSLLTMRWANYEGGGELPDLFNYESLDSLWSVGDRYWQTHFTREARELTFFSPRLRTRSITLDAKGRQVATSAPGYADSQQTYLPTGELASRVLGSGPEARATTYRYDALHRPSGFEDPAGREFAFTYDAADRPLTATLADGAVVATAYDAGSHVISITPPGRPATLFTYYPTGLPATLVEPDVGDGTAVTTFHYDKGQRLRRQVFADGSEIGFSYRFDGRPQALTTADREISFDYHLTTAKLEGLRDSAGSQLFYQYAGFLLESESWAGIHSGHVGREYDEALRLRELKVNDADPIAYGYDEDSLLLAAGGLQIDRDPAVGRETTTRLGRIATARTYNAFGELETWTVTDDGEEIYFEGYAYDKLGWVTDLERRVHGGAPVLHHYDYDPRGRLEEVWQDGALVASYGYDVNSNRLSYDGPFGRGVAGTYDGRDRLLAYGGATYTYSPLGDLATKTAGGQTTTYGYDEFGNLLRVELGNGIEIEYLVDAQQRRIAKVVDGARVKGWLYQSPLHPIAELDAEGNVVSRFVYGTRVNVPDYLIKGGNTYRIVADHLGSPRLIVDVATGTIAQELRYDEFGRVLLDTQPGFQPFGYAGGLYDHQTGLVRFGVRDYDPETGRWTAQDPIGFRGGSTNLYHYAHGNPLNFIDPSGKIAPAAVAAIAWGVAEVGLALWDLYDAGRTLFDPCASVGDKLSAGGGVLLGTALPGGGYDDLAEAAYKGRKHFTGPEKAWATGATPHSKYTQTHKTMDDKAIQTTIYDADGNAIGQVDWKPQHGTGSGHGHGLATPGDFASGHQGNGDFYEPGKLPEGWGDLPPGIGPIG